MTLSHDAQLILLGALISLVSSIITALVNHYLSLHADKVKRARDKDASQNSIIVPTASQISDAMDLLRISDVSSYSYGISIDEIIYNVLYKENPVPAERTIRLPSKEKLQKKVEFMIWQNNSNNASVEREECEPIGRLEFELPEELPADSLFNVTFRLDEIGLLTVSVEDPVSHQLVVGQLARGRLVK